MMREDQRAPSRRTFLKGVFGGAAALAVTSLAAACQAPATRGNPAPGGSGSTSGQAAPAQAAAGKGELKIGLLAGFSGPYAAFGPDFANSAQLYLELHNNALAGMKVNIIQEDEGATTQDAVNKTRKLLQQDQVDVFMGIVSSANALAIRDMLDAAKTPTLVTNANANEITGDRSSPYIFRTAVTAFQSGAAMGKWMWDHGYKKIVALAPDYAAGHQWVDAITKEFGSYGGAVADSIFPPLGNTDYAPHLAKVKPDSPDAVWASFAGSDAIKFLQQYNQFIGTSLPLIGGGANQQVTDQVKRDALAVTSGSSPWEPTLDTPINKLYVSEYFKRFNALPAYGQYTWDAMAFLDKILSGNGGDKSPDAIVKGFRDTTEFESVRGTLKVDPETHGLIIEQWRTKPEQDGDKITVMIHESLGTFAPFKRLS